MWSLCGSNKSRAAEPEFGSLVPLGSPPQSKHPAQREREHSLKEKCWCQGGIQDGVWVGTQLPGWQKPIKEGAGQWVGRKPGQVGHCGPETSCTRGVKQILPKESVRDLLAGGRQCDPPVYIAYWTWLSAICDIFTGLDSTKVLLKERKQPKERSLSIALIICWRMVQGAMWALPWWMGRQQIQAQHKLLSVTACSSGSGWLLGRWQP